MPTLKAKRIQEKYESQILGLSEPKSISKNNYKSDLLKALNVYNVSHDDKDKKSWAINYIKSSNHKSNLDIFNKTPDWKFRTVGTLIRINERGLHLEPNDLKKIDLILNAIVKEYIPPKLVIDNVPAKIVIPKVIDEACASINAEFNYFIDSFILNSIELPDVKSKFHELEVTSKNGNQLVNSIKSLTNELEEVINSKDEELTYAWSCYKISNLKKLYNWLSNIPKLYTEHIIGNKIRKPRVTKPKTPLQQVSKLKYLKEDESNSLKSINPTKIVGANGVIIYDTKTRKMTYYSGSNFTVKGSVILNFEPDESCTKLIRKIEKVHELINLPKKSFEKEFREVKSAESVPKGKVSSTCIIAKAF